MMSNATSPAVTRREMSINFSGAKGRRDSCCKNACSLSNEWDARRVHVKQANEEGCTYTCTHTHAARVARQRDSEKGWSPVHPSFILQTPSATLLALDARSANKQLFQNKNSLSTSDSRPMINGSWERGCGCKGTPSLIRLRDSC